MSVAIWPARVIPETARLFVEIETSLVVSYRFPSPVARKVPTGIVRHDKCENGTKLGKTDPGHQFDQAGSLPT
ncbi:hypothetical protein LCGC14_2001220 [marine sediment metagenome]|uniref:Uncharacterized protein n=1 Tax=marine sediment metagenome TaxID=412755 RepID=A0A0F9I0B1_9ZZZZ